MKRIILLLAVILLGSLGLSLTAAEREYYQVKIYWIEKESQEAVLDHYLERAYLPALHRAGISKVGVFKPIEGRNEAQPFVMVFIPFHSLHQVGRRFVRIRGC